MFAAFVLTTLTLPHADVDTFLQDVPVLVLDGTTDQTRAAARRLTTRGKPDRVKRLWYPVNQEIHQNLLRAAAREGIPLIPASRARLDVGSSAAMQVLSRQLRSAGFTSGTDDTPLAGKDSSEKADVLAKLGTSARIDRYPGVPATLWQMLQVEDEPLRRTMVDFLAKSPSASDLLARCAVYDSSAKVREASRKALKQRPPASYLPTLLKAVSHPWPAARENATVALQELRPAGAKPALQKLLEEAPPGVPFRDKRTGKLVVRELVRLNHLRNCLLCHEPASRDMDGFVQPAPSDPYYNQGSFVRADVTYVRPDFSAMIDTKTKRGLQRYDFLLRTRPATRQEIETAKELPPRMPAIERLLESFRDGGK